MAFGAPRQNDIENAAGKPDATAEGSFELPGFPPYRALGYDCSDAQDTLHRPLVYSTQPPFCATVYYVNASNGLLEAFWSSSPHFKSLQNVSPGMTVARAAVAENQKLTVGCGNPDFTEGGNRYPALVKLETINAAANAHDQGSFQINDITSESNKHGVGLFGC